jgi:hypothetical protein
MSGEAEILASAQEWMNRREIHFIELHDTYRRINGFNKTKGGQNGMDAAFFEAMLRKSERNFRTKYIPAFRKWRAQNNKGIWKVRRSDKIDIGTGDPVNVGELLMSMRKRETSVPTEHLSTMNELGYRDGKSYKDCLWDLEYITAFRKWQASTNGLPIWKARHLDKIDIGTGDPINVGTLLKSMRTGDTRIPAEYLSVLNELGFNDGKSHEECTWSLEYLPAFRKWHAENKEKPIWKIPNKCKITINTGVSVNIGWKLSNLRSGSDRVPAEYLQEMNDLGFCDGKTQKECKKIKA